MGHGIALALARQGCAVACVDVASHEHSLRRACDSITASTGSTATAFTADCTDRAELAAAFLQATEQLGPLRIAPTLTNDSLVQTDQFCIEILYYLDCRWGG
jgi:NAD(P)-dependent dehydrogenase (short-subunit alcohol dehydrogenase family)